MWIFCRSPYDGQHVFLSAVSDRDDPERLLVRARFRGDLEAMFPEAEVHEDVGTDYRFRAWVDRVEVVQMIADAATEIDYTNFKSTVAEPWREQAYFDVWAALVRAQEERRHAERGAR